MAIRAKGALDRQFRTVFNLGAIGDLTDGQLLERFATHGGEAAELAFAALLERHGPMVMRVCRLALGDPHDAEDSFQAAFLILVKKARSLWVRDSLGPWLHRVAYRVATRARLSSARLRKHEHHAAAARSASVCERVDRDELFVLIHEEIDRLPERYRVPVVLCDLQGLTHDKAARHLGWPVGTVKSRLGRARELLRGRLCRRGLGQPAGLLICEKSLGGAFRTVEVVLPSQLIESTVGAAIPIAAGKALAIGAISSRVAIMIEEVEKTMIITKLKLASMFILLIGGAGAAGVLAQQGSQRGPTGRADQTQGPATPELNQVQGVGPVRAPAPAFIRQSRAMILTRLEDEVAEARARLDRTLRKFRAPDDPAVVRARETLEALEQRLDRIDRVLVDVVETYPTMVDFSGGPANDDQSIDVGQGQQSGASNDPQQSWSKVRRAVPFTRRNVSGASNDPQQSWSKGRGQQSNSPQGSEKSGQNSQGQQPGSEPSADKSGQSGQGQPAGSKPSSQKSGESSQGQQPGSEPSADKSGQSGQGQPAGSKPSSQKSGESSQGQQPGSENNRKNEGHYIQGQQPGGGKAAYSN